MKKFVIVTTICMVVLTSMYADSLRILNPEVRSESRMITDTLNNRIVLFGGNNRDLWGKCFNDVWSFDLGTGAWEFMDLSEPLPAPRHDASTVYDALENRMILFGGWNGLTWTFYNDVWALDLLGSEEWTQLMPSGTPPSIRAATNAVIDPVNKRMVLFGGADGTYGYNDTWSLDLNTLTWLRLSPSGTLPPARFAHATVYDSAEHRMVIFGGSNYGQPFLNDVWALDLTYGNEAWQQLSPGGTQPEPRAQHFYAFHAFNRDMVIGFGYYWPGYHIYLNDVWALNLNSMRWRRVLQSDVVEARRGSCAAYDPSSHQIIIFGGDRSGYYWGDTYALMLDPLGVEENQTSDDLISSYIKISSNPSRLPLRMEISLPFAGEINLKIMDISGRLVNTLAKNRRSDNYVIQWNGEDNRGRRVPAGTYFIKLNVDGQSVAKKTVVIE